MVAESITLCETWPVKTAWWTERDEDSGKFAEEYPLEDFLDALDELGPSGTTDVSDYVGCDRRTAYLKLQALEDDGEISSRKVGNALLWELDE